MKRLSLNVWNDWCWLSRQRMDLTLFRVSLDYAPGKWAAVDVVVLGFGVALAWYAKGAKA